MSLRMDFEVSNVQPDPVSPSQFLLPADPDVELSITSPVQCLPVFAMLSCHADKEVNL